MHSLERMAIGNDADRAPGARPRPPAAPKEPDPLTLRLREIAKSVASPEDALEPMLHAIGDSTGAVAGAVLLYDVRLRLLRLAVEAGLSDEGCKKLRIIRKGEADAWEMPLHGLINGRAYLIDNASQNRFVPRLVDEASEMTTVVCLPLYSGQTPLASVILVAQKPRRFEERQLHAVEAPLQEMARIIEATRRHAEGRTSTAPITPRPAPAPGAPAGPPTAAELADLANLRTTLARVEAERDRLALALEAHTGDGARAADLQGELDRLRARLGEAEASVLRERSTREELEARFDGGATAGRQELQRAQSAVREAESARAAALAEAARLRTELERARLDSVQAPAAPAELDARVVELLAEVDQLRAGLAEAKAGAAHEQRAREELEGRLAGGVNAGQQELRKALAAARDAERDRMAAVAEATRLRSELELVRIEATPGPSAPGERDDRIGPLLAEIDRLRARLAEAEAGAAHEHRARDELETRLAQGVTASQQELRRALEAARVADEARATSVAEMGRLRAELDRARSDAARAPGSREEIDGRVVELAAEIDRLRTRVAEAEAGAAHQHRAREELEARLSGGVSSTQQDLRKALDAARQAEQERAAAVAEAARLQAEVERARLAATETPEQASQTANRWTEFTAEIDRLHTRLAEAEAGAAHEHRAREALEARLAEITGGASQELQRAVETARAAEEARAALEAEAARLADELRAARAEAARVPEVQSAAEARTAELAAEVERLAAAVAAAEAHAAEERHAREAVEARLTTDAAEAERARDAALADARERAEAAARTELARVTQELAAARDAAARAEGLAAALAEAEHGRKELVAALDAVRAEGVESAREVGARAAAAMAAHGAELDALRARLADAEATAAREQRARAALEAAASSDLDRRESDLRAALESVRVVEEARDHALGELTTARHELAQSRTASETLARDLAERTSEIDRLAAEIRVAGEARDEQLALLEAARRRNDEASARLVDLEADVARLYDERAAADCTLARVETERDALRESHVAAAAERDRLAAELQDATAAAARVERALAGALEEADTRKQALAEALARADELAARVAEKERALAARASDAMALGSRLDSVTRESDELRAAYAALGADRDRLAAELEGATAGKARLEQSLQEALEASRAREQAALEEARAASMALAERDAALQTLGERLASETAARQARIDALVTELDAGREAVAAIAAERDRLAADLEGAAAGKARLEQSLQETMEEARSRDEDLREMRGRLWEATAHIDETTRSLATQNEASAREIEMLTGRVKALTIAAHDLRDAHAAAVAGSDRLAADLEGVAAAKAHLEDTLQRVLEEGRTRDQEAYTSLETARAQLWTTAARLTEVEQRIVGIGEERAAEVAAFSARVDGLEAEADRLRDVELTVSAERDRLAASLEGSAAAKAHLEEALKSALDGARSRDQETAAILQETRGQAWVAAARLADAEVTLRALAEERTTEVASLTARAEALSADADRLREAEATAANERDHLAAELAGVRASHERLEQTLAEVRERDEAAATRLAYRERELDTLRAELTAAQADAESARAELDASRAEIASTRAELETTRAEAESTRAELDAARTAQSASTPATTAGPAAPRLTVPRPGGTQSSTAAGPKPNAPSLARPSAPAAPPPPAVPEPTSSVVAVLDQEGAWNGVDLGAVVAVVPTDEAVRKLAADWPGTMLANLAAPGVMKALVTMRGMRAPTRIVGFLATGADRALPLGAIEPASLPLAPDAIVAALARHAPAKARVVTVGADVDALLSLRQALARAGTSVSLAWDGKQATDLLDMVHPHAVVADLGAPYDACAVLGRLAASSPVPAAVLIEGTADASAALAMALNNPDVAAKILPRKDLLAVLARSPAAKGPALRPPAAGAVGVRR